MDQESKKLLPKVTDSGLVYRGSNPYLTAKSQARFSCERRAFLCCYCGVMRLLDPVDDAFVREIVADRDGIADVLHHLLQARPVRIDNVEFPLAAAVRQE